MELVITDDASLKDVTSNDALFRLYQYWVAKRGARRRLPTRQDPLEFTYALSRVSLVDIQDTPPRFHYRLLSTTLTQRLGYEMTGKFADEIPEIDVRAYVEDLYTRAAALRAPIFERSKRVFDDKVWNHEALILPLASDGMSVDMLMIYRITDNPQPLPRWAQTSLI